MPENDERTHTYNSLRETVQTHGEVIGVADNRILTDFLVISAWVCRGCGATVYAIQADRDDIPAHSAFGLIEVGGQSIAEGIPINLVSCHDDDEEFPRGCE